MTTTLLHPVSSDISYKTTQSTGSRTKWITQCMDGFNSVFTLSFTGFFFISNGSSLDTSVPLHNILQYMSEQYAGYQVVLILIY